ncbi:MAG: diguanylate cyclase [Flavobacteriaceae bacterium]
MWRVSTTKSRQYIFIGPLVGLLILICAVAGWHVGLLDLVAASAAGSLCVMFMLMPIVIRRLTAFANLYAGGLFASLHLVALYVGLAGDGLLHPAGYFSTVFPIISAVFVGRAAGLINASIAIVYVATGLWKYLYFPSPMEAQMTFGVAIVQCMSMLTTMALGYWVAQLFVLHSHAAARQQAETNVRLERAQADAAKALDNMSNGLTMFAPDGTIQLYNDRVVELCGADPSLIYLGMHFEDYVRTLCAAVGWDDIRTQRVIDNYAVWLSREETTRFENLMPNGKILSVACRPLKGGGAIFTYDDVTEVREGQKKIAHMAFHDALTGLPNRRSFAEQLEILAQRGPFTMLMIDLDRFKAVNDMLGHAIGDRLLVEASKRLSDVCGVSDLAFRLGGDELGVLSRCGVELAAALARDIVTALSAPFHIGEHVISIGCSIGVAGGEENTPPQLVQQMADLALTRRRAAVAAASKSIARV